MIKRIGIGLALLLAGLPVGAGGAYAALRFFPQLFHLLPGAHSREMIFVESDILLVPLVFPTGRLAGYISIECELEVPKDTENDVKERLPLFLNAVNLRTYRSPLASGPDGQLPDLKALRAVLVTAAEEVYGKHLVRKVLITRSSPV